MIPTWKTILLQHYKNLQKKKQLQSSYKNTQINLGPKSAYPVFLFVC